MRSKARMTRRGDAGGGAPSVAAPSIICCGAASIGARSPISELFYPGQHPAIIDAKIFDAVQRRLDNNRAESRRSASRSASALLTGRVFDAHGDPMSPSFSYGRGGRLYRYYIAMALQRGGRPSSDDAAIQPCSGRRSRGLRDRTAMSARLRSRAWMTLACSPCFAAWSCAKAPRTLSSPTQKLCSETTTSTTRVRRPASKTGRWSSARCASQMTLAPFASSSPRGCSFEAAVALSSQCVDGCSGPGRGSTLAWLRR